MYWYGTKHNVARKLAKRNGAKKTNKNFKRTGGLNLGRVVPEGEKIDLKMILNLS